MNETSTKSPLPASATEGKSLHAVQPTDFASLKRSVEPKIASLQRRSMTDLLVDFLTPFMIFVMITSVIYFLLDVRYVYTAVSDFNLRMVAFCFIMGVVALNRLIVRDGKEESALYFIALAGAIGMYTLATTSLYEVGSVARGFMNHPVVATAFNMVIVVFIWWLTNRLTHECCVDTNPSAGDIGILTGTVRGWREAMRAQPDARPSLFRKRQKEPVILQNIYEPVDPSEWKPPEAKKAPTPVGLAQRLPKRHPGVSIFYFSVPVMFIFALGQRVIQNGGPGMVLAGHLYLGAYTVAALMLLMLSSLGGLREYFRERRIRIPGGLGPFWIGLGMVMLAIVLIGATALPLPGLPSTAFVDYHEDDPWNRGDRFQMVSVVTPAAEVLRQAQFMQRVGQGVLVCLGLFLAYGALRGLGVLAANVARQRHRYPRFVVRFFNAVERFLERILRVPSLPKFQPRRHVQRDIALSANYRNPLGDPVQRERMTTADLVAHAYDAMCALATDLGVPRRVDQTPFEFIQSFPKELETLREEAFELTDLYVVSAYSAIPLEGRVEDRLRTFWRAYDRVRNRVVR
ncbi:MAG: DUF4129 domain-containing protein [Candidatus Hydrogenedentes bacterium]|nr:DUF4129 domain-containing protein [Candidatus Hydrogenedentota bacterium]